MNHVVINKLNNIQENEIFNNDLIFYSNSSLSNLIKDSQVLVTFDIKTVKKLRENYADGLT